MKKIGTLRLAFTFSGCFLGAGYVSGQELWQFFGQHGKRGIIGLMIALLLLCAIGTITLLLSRDLGKAETDQLIVCWDAPLLRLAVFTLESVFLFSVCIIMTAGAGALCNEVFGMTTWMGCAAFVLLVIIVSFAGLDGMVTAFSATVPILVLVTLYFGIRTAAEGGIVFQASPEETSNPLLRFWPLASVLFASYNVFGSIAILAPLGMRIRKERTVIVGITVGALLLLMVAVSVLISVCAARTQSSELPMLSFAISISSRLGWCYGILLLLAMFGTCLSCFVAFTRSTGEKLHIVGKNRNLFLIACGIVIFFGSLFGFGDLISVVYPVFGYCSSIFIIMLIITYVKVKRLKKIADGT